LEGPTGIGSMYSVAQETVAKYFAVHKIRLCAREIPPVRTWVPDGE
jgi:hypothetical protein